MDTSGCTACYDSVNANPVGGTSRCDCNAGFYDADADSGNAGLDCRGWLRPGFIVTERCVSPPPPSRSFRTALGQGCQQSNASGICSSCSAAFAVPLQNATCGCQPDYYDTNPGTGPADLVCQGAVLPLWTVLPTTPLQPVEVALPDSYSPQCCAPAQTMAVEVWLASFLAVVV